jgi:transposase
MLTRSRYLLLINPENWNEYQQNSAKLLFENFPNLEKALDLITDFRTWYKAKPKYFEPFENERTLGNWIDKAENSNYNEMKNFRNILQNH